MSDPSMRPEIPGIAITTILPVFSRLAIAGIFVFAGFFKVAELTVPLFWDRSVSIFQVAQLVWGLTEIGVGLALLLRPYRWLVQSVLGISIVFLIRNSWMMLDGSQYCGCFGALPVPLLVALIVNGMTILFALAIVIGQTRPRSGADVQNSCKGTVLAQPSPTLLGRSFGQWTSFQAVTDRTDSRRTGRFIIAVFGGLLAPGFVLTLLSWLPPSSAQYVDSMLGRRIKIQPSIVEVTYNPRVDQCLSFPIQFLNNTSDNRRIVGYWLEANTGFCGRAFRIHGLPFAIGPYETQEINLQFETRKIEDPEYWEQLKIALSRQAEGTAKFFEKATYHFITEDLGDRSLRLGVELRLESALLQQLLKSEK